MNPTITLIQQRTPHDCTIACMAMLTGRSYEYVITAVGDAFHPERGMREEQKALQRLGYTYEFEGGHLTERSDMSCMHRPYMLSAEFFRGFAWGRRALMSVPSLNNPGGWHMVYWHFDGLFDPSTRKTYSGWNELRPETMVLFSEAWLPAEAA